LKTKTLWVHFISHSRERKWQWKPLYSRSQMIYGMGGKTWIAPIYEFCWLFIVFQLTRYGQKKEYHGGHVEHDCQEEIMQVRINELENAIRIHRDHMHTPTATDRLLWQVLGD
jgi:hypothetical protein